MAKPPKTSRPNVMKTAKAAAKRDPDYHAQQAEKWAQLLAQPFTPAPKGQP